jgi:hypothetical protein
VAGELARGPNPKRAGSGAKVSVVRRLAGGQISLGEESESFTEGVRKEIVKTIKKFNS